MSEAGFWLNAGTITSISALVSAVSVAITRVLTVKGKYRAQAVDVLADAALTSRQKADDAEADNSDLRSALQNLINIIEYGAGNGGLNNGTLVRLYKATAHAKRMINRPTRREGRAEAAAGEN